MNLYYLLLDSSQSNSCVALVEKKDEKFLLKSQEIAQTQVSASESLLPLIDEVLKREKLNLKNISAFGVGVGPGSFTGIRIGLATIRAFAQVLNKPVMPLSSLRSLALSAKLNDQDKVSVKAYQGQCFIGYFNEKKIWIEDLAFLELEEIQTPGAITGVGLMKAFEEEFLNKNASGFLNFQDVHPRYLRPSQAEINLEKKRAESIRGTHEG